VLTTLAEIPQAEFQIVAGPEALKPRNVSHQRTDNRCPSGGPAVLPHAAWCRSERWTADPHAPVR